jgi:hypothetical protein
MAQIKGQFAEITVDVASTATKAAKLTNWSISTSSNKVDTTAAGDTWESHLVGTHNWSGSAEISDIDTFWWALATGDTLPEIVFYQAPSATSGTVKYTGKASIDYDEDVPFEDLITASITFTGSGALVKGTVPS